MVTPMSTIVMMIAASTFCPTKVEIAAATRRINTRGLVSVEKNSRIPEYRRETIGSFDPNLTTRSAASAEDSPIGTDMFEFVSANCDL